jgi:hypothetical protein
MYLLTYASPSRRENLERVCEMGREREKGERERERERERDRDRERERESRLWFFLLLISR